MNAPKIDLTGQRFGRLTVLEYRKANYWKCRCDCGTICEIRGYRMTAGITKSCGCLKRGRKGRWMGCDPNDCDNCPYDDCYIPEQYL